jgi:Na+/melibiose symporter-like transporter
MSTLTRWWARAAAIGSAVTLSLSVPAVAWASGKPGLLTVSDELARRIPLRRSRFSAIGLLGTLCCLAVVLVVVLLVVMLTRRGRSRRR